MKIGEILVDWGLISPRELENALGVQKDVKHLDSVTNSLQTDDNLTVLSGSDSDRYGDMLSVGDVARMLNVHVNTVRRWDKSELLHSYRINARGDRRFQRDEIVALIARFKDFNLKNGLTLMKNEKGSSLIELAVAMAILGIITVGFFNGLCNASRNLSWTDEKQTAITLAESQIEYVKSLPEFASTYSPAVSTDEYPGYSVEIYGDNLTSRDTNIQKIRVIVSHQGRPIINAFNSTLEGYKVK